MQINIHTHTHTRARISLHGKNNFPHRRQSFEDCAFVSRRNGSKRDWIINKGGKVRKLVESNPCILHYSKRYCTDWALLHRSDSQMASTYFVRIFSLTSVDTRSTTKELFTEWVAKVLSYIHKYNETLCHVSTVQRTRPNARTLRTTRLFCTAFQPSIKIISVMPLGM